VASTLDTAMSSPQSLRGLTNQLEDVRRHADRLRKLSDGCLQSAACDLRESFARADTPLTTVTEGLALSVEALRRTVGVELYDVQLMASLATSLGNVAEMQTGEGKTFSVAPAAILSALRGNAVHVATPNVYLAERDYALLRPVFEVLGISAGLVGDSNAAPAAKKAAYDCEVTYATGFDLGFDYLRDQAARQSTTHSSLGVELLKKLRGETMAGRSTIQRGHPMAIVDEIDHVLLDDAGSPLILCDAPHGNAEDAEACQLARRLVDGSLVGGLVNGEHFHLRMTGTVSLTESGNQRIHAHDVSIPVKKLLRPWSEYVQQAIRARFCFQRDVHYVLDKQQIQIVDGSTGRIFSDRTWSEGLHQAIEAKEGLAISSERSVMAQVTRQRYFRIYRKLAGMTGTAVGCEAEFRKIYNLKIWEIPRRKPCQRKLYPPRAFANVEAKYTAIAEDASAMHRTGRPILIGTSTIVESELMAALLRQRRLAFQLLNGRQDAEEAAVIAEAGKKNAITIATNMAGRGTDIRLDQEVKSLGGLHVIVAAPNELQRVDRQLIGRCARQGDEGSAQTFVSADDDLIRIHGPWLERPLRNCADRHGELQIDISQRLRNVQQLVERKQSSARLQLMQQDLARESLFSRLADHL
jgi:preprotein translocase subunit SecA